jgi:hypothetical protein
MEKYITPSRFDLMAKYLYLKYSDEEFYINLYKSHILTFNLGWEHPGTKKNLDEFVNNFNQLINSIKSQGYINKHPIEVGKNNIIVNGSHRLMISYYNNIKPNIKLINQNGCSLYHYDFFIDRDKYWKRDNKSHPNLDNKYTDTMALAYLDIKKDLRPLIFYPVSYKIFKKNEKKVLDILKKYGRIYYLKKIKLKKIQFKNLLKELYRGESWIGGLFPNDSCGGKLDVCFYDDYTMFYLFEFNDLKDHIKMKTEIRNIFKLNKNSIHIADNNIETFRICSCILNQNSINFLNHDLNLSEKNKLIKLFNQKNNQNLCWNLELDQKITDFKIINNPDKYFYINGYKIINL